MAVLYADPYAPVEEFFYATPPRWVVPYLDVKEAINALKEKRCKYVLAQEGIPVPKGLEIRARRPGFILIQRAGQVTRSDMRAIRARAQGTSGPQKPYCSD